MVFDDRPEYANRTRFPLPTELCVLETYTALPIFTVDTDSYIVIVTRGHLHDKTVLEWALQTRACYIGMIGSKRKRDMIFASLIDQGYNAGDVKRIYSPIGIDIFAETPEEIAVSIIAELIKVRAEQEHAQ